MPISMVSMEKKLVEKCPTSKFLPHKTASRTNTIHYTDPYDTHMDQKQQLNAL